MTTLISTEEFDPLAPSIQRDARTHGSHLPAGWPLFALFGFYPLWWVLGISEFACLIFAVPMVLHLVRQGRVVVPKGFGVWLLFVFWVVGGIFVLQVHAPGTVTGASSTRYPTFTYRLLWYIGATVVMLYVVNTRRELSNYRISLALSNMFVVVTFGGLVGMLAPHLQFRSGLEYVLPKALRGNGFVHQLIHPVTAQVQHFLGYQEARPSAPFAFTNEWGLAIACFLPFFLLTWCQRDAGWRRTVAPGVLLLATVGVVFSLNRGLWLALAGSGVFIAVRYALMGRYKILALLGGVVLMVVALIAFTPLGSLVLARLAHPDSNQGRTNLGSLTLSSVLQGSPIVGFGTTRNVLGNFTSIASAASTSCPGCSPPPLGTQGHLWLVLFSQGLVGLALYLAFFVVLMVRHIRMRSPYAVAALTVIIVHFITMPVYDSIGPALFAIMVSVGILAREDIAREARPRNIATARPVELPSERLLSSYFELGRRRVAALVILAVTGALAGGLYEAIQPPKVSAVRSVLVPQSFASSSRAPLTIDTYAQLLTSNGVLMALARTQPGVDLNQLAGRLDVSALPNTRIVRVSYTAGSTQAALLGLRTTTRAYLRVLSHATGRPGSRVGQPSTVDAPAVKRSLDPWIVSATTGVMGALAMGLLFNRLVGGRRFRVRRRRRATETVNGLPVVAELTLGVNSAPNRGELARAHKVLARLSVESVVAAEGSRAARRVAAGLDAQLWPARTVRRGGTLIVVSSKTPRGEVSDLHGVLQHWGQPIAGVVMVLE